MAKRILIFEDDALNRRLFNDLLAAEGYETVTSDGTEDALSLARRVAPDLIVMDINMPHADGAEATRRITRDRATAGIPVVAVTGCALPGDEQRIREAGCAGYLAKPVALDRFLGVIDRLIVQAAHETLREPANKLSAQVA